MTRFLPLLLASALLVAVTGCGQKGALYLPDQQQTQDKDAKAK